ncbi:MAG: glycosyltransferase family 1 protein [Micromonosporaceae bacterium]|nr:glycosyltransferase family 1 protein [Micromonosporaceae bacterium]
MTTVLILAIGTRGDIAPFTGLGTRLAQAGYRVAIATQPPFAHLVTDCGLEYREIPGDPRSYLATDTGQKALDTGPRAMASSMKLIKQGTREVCDGVLTVLQQGCDLALLTHGTAPMYPITEALGIPSIGVPLVPIEPTGDFPPPALSRVPVPGRWGNRTIARLSAAGTLKLFTPATNEIRQRLGKPSMTGRGMLREMAERNWPVLCGYSPVLLPRPADWRAGVDVVGYWWPESPGGWQPPADLVDFLAAGPPPVFITLGSMATERKAEVGTAFAAALREAGVRGIIQAGWAGMALGADHQLFTVDEVPYDWLFPQLSAVVHHAGAGTTGAGLRAGVPAVGVPVWLDQPFWSGRLVELGVSPAMIPLRRLDARRLAGAIRAAVEEPGYRGRAQEVAAQVNAEDGAGQVVAAVQRVLGQQVGNDRPVRS